MALISEFTRVAGKSAAKHVLVAFMGVGLLAGCGSSPQVLQSASARRAPALAESSASGSVDDQLNGDALSYWKTIFDSLDSDHDGQLTPGEAEPMGWDASTFASVDANHDGKISLSEWLAVNRANDTYIIQSLNQQAAAIFPALTASASEMTLEQFDRAVVQPISVDGKAIVQGLGPASAKTISAAFLGVAGTSPAIDSDAFSLVMGNLFAQGYGVSAP